MLSPSTLEEEAFRLWQDVFRAQVMSGPREPNWALAETLREARDAAETPQQCVDRAAALADAAEAKLRERVARWPDTALQDRRAYYAMDHASGKLVPVDPAA